MQFKSVVALLFVLPGFATETVYQTEASYYATIASLYNAYNESTVDFIARSSAYVARTVYIRVGLLAINDVNEVDGTLELMLYMPMSWTDDIVTASGYNYSNLFDYTTTGVYSVLMPAGTIWTPKLVLVNAVDESGAIGGKSYRPRYYVNDGTVIWTPMLKIRSACAPDVKYYPFDMQTCTCTFLPWGRYYTELLFQANRSHWDFSYYETNGEWDIVDTTIATTIDTVLMMSMLKLTITIERKPLYFAFNIILPILVLVVLNGMVFWLPVESGERVGFSVTCFLSFVVLLNMIMDILPRSSSPMSYLCFYTVNMMAFSGLTTGVVIAQMRLFHKPEKEKVPMWIQHFVRILKCRCRKKQESEECPDEELEIKVVPLQVPAAKANKVKPVADVAVPMQLAKGKTSNNNVAPNNVVAGAPLKKKTTVGERRNVHTVPSKGGKSLEDTLPARANTVANPMPNSVTNNTAPKRPKATKKNKVKPVPTKPVEPEVDADVVTWPEVTRVLDMFAFLTFLGGQALFTVLFVVPIAANV